MENMSKNILSTSSLIKSLYEDDEPENINYIEESERLFELFSSNKKLKIDGSIVKNYTKKFNILYNTNFFKEFKAPHIKEYFCQQLNFLLLCDFILSFYRLEDKSFNIKSINTLFLFDFFVKLGEFYAFMDYLSVDELFINYLRYMLTLYTLQLDRDVIEKNFASSIETLDNFFSHLIVPKIFSHIKYKNLDIVTENLNAILKQNPDELKDINENKIDFTTDEYKFLDNYFNYYAFCSKGSNIEVKKTAVKMPNPNPQPVNNDNNNSDNESDYDDDYYDGYDSDESWQPTVTVYVPNIDKTDVNYEKYKKEFIIRTYQLTNKKHKKIKNEIKTVSEALKIKDYSNFPVIIDEESITNNFSDIKIILGVKINVTDLDKKKDGHFIYSMIYKTACEFGHLNIVKDLLNYNPKSTKESRDLIEYATNSPNREILKYLIQNKSKYPSIENDLKYYSGAVYFEPKIIFNK